MAPEKYLCVKKDFGFLRSLSYYILLLTASVSSLVSFASAVDAGVDKPFLKIYNIRYNMRLYVGNCTKGKDNSQFHA